MPRALVPLADGFEEMEGIIIIDVLRRAGAEVVSASLSGDVVTGSRGTRHLADTSLDEALKGEYDMIVLPGGAVGAKNLEHDPRVAKILREMHQKNRYIGAICAAPNVLRNHGVIGEQVDFTLHPDTLGFGQGGSYRASARLVRSGHITTSVGPGSAFEFALDLVEQLFDRATRERVEQPMYLPA